jgi:hypothetical protein
LYTAHSANTAHWLARILKSRTRRGGDVRFGSGGGVGDRPSDRDLGG